MRGFASRFEQDRCQLSQGDHDTLLSAGSVGLSGRKPYADSFTGDDDELPVGVPFDHAPDFLKSGEAIGEGQIEKTKKNYAMAVAENQFAEI